MARFQRAGDAKAFNDIVKRCLPRALAVARELLGDASAAEDAVQDAFLRVVRRQDTYQPKRPFGSWFFAILRNACADALRARARQARLVRAAAGMLATMRPPVCEPVASSLLARLPKGEREVLTLRIAHELSFREVAAAMGISEGFFRTLRVRPLGAHTADVRRGPAEALGRGQGQGKRAG